jgi:hypothetical protein
VNEDVFAALLWHTILTGESVDAVVEGDSVVVVLSDPAQSALEGTGSVSERRRPSKRRIIQNFSPGRAGREAHV